jgi:hypothetical protein
LNASRETVEADVSVRLGRESSSTAFAELGPFIAFALLAAVVSASAVDILFAGFAVSLRLAAIPTFLARMTERAVKLGIAVAIRVWHTFARRTADETLRAVIVAIAIAVLTAVWHAGFVADCC